MIFHIKRAVLAEEMGRLQSVVGKKNTIPILNYARIQSSPEGGHRVNLCATNLETTIFSEARADLVEQPGSLVVPARQLFDILKLMSDGLVRIERAENDFIKVSSGGSKFNLASADPAQYPEVPDTSELNWLDLPAKHLRQMLNSVNCAVAPEEDARYNLKGARVEMDGTEVRMITSDGHRVCLAYGPLEALLMEDLEVLLPQVGMEELGKVISDFDGMVRVATDGTKIFFKVGTRLLATSLMVGEFPEWRLVFATVKDYEHFATFKADDLTRAIRRTMLMSDNSLALSMRFEAGALSMHTQGADVGEADEVMPSDFNGPDLKVHCNGKFLLDFLSPLGSSAIRLELKDRLMPLHFKGEKDGVTYRYIVMPMNVPG